MWKKKNWVQKQQLHVKMRQSQKRISWIANQYPRTPENYAEAEEAEECPTISGGIFGGVGDGSEFSGVWGTTPFVCLCLILPVNNSNERNEQFGGTSMMDSPVRSPGPFSMVLQCIYTCHIAHYHLTTRTHTFHLVVPLQLPHARTSLCTGFQHTSLSVCSLTKSAQNQKY
jgi:hypothetical protein